MWLFCLGNYTAQPDFKASDYSQKYMPLSEGRTREEIIDAARKMAETEHKTALENMTDIMGALSRTLAAGNMTGIMNLTEGSIMAAMQNTTQVEPREKKKRSIWDGLQWFKGTVWPPGEDSEVASLVPAVIEEPNSFADPKRPFKRQADAYERLEELKDKEILKGGLSDEEKKDKARYEKALKDRREAQIDEDLAVPRRKKQREIIQMEVNVKMQDMENLKNSTWRKLKLKELDREIGRLIDERDGFDPRAG